MDAARARFLDATARALQTGRTTLSIVRNRMSSLRSKKEELAVELTSLDQRIVLAESGLTTLESEFNVASEVLKGLILDENKARMDAEQSNEMVRLGRLANVPFAPVLPNPMMIFGAGIALSLFAGVLFVLVMDNLEDTIVNLRDIEGRLSLKVLAVLPHVRRKKREQVAKFTVEDKYSPFSEAVAGLRNLLESPRYEALSRCVLVISTQPGEGKTITSTSLAISYALAGRSTLHVDFDLRRPRLAHVWNLDLPRERSFSHALQKAGKTIPDFSKLVNRSSVPNLDVIASLPPDGISPSEILGSDCVPAFFEWARKNYDRIIVDSPPYGVVGDVVSLSVLVDSALIMCCPDRTHFRPVQYCSRSLTEAGATILGVIVNDVDVSNSSAFSQHAISRSYGYYGARYRHRGDGDNAADGASAAVENEDYADDD
jgi:capsular exopolysaccharide synthesis family protein